MFDFEQALRRVIDTDGSDLHLKVPARPLMLPEVIAEGGYYGMQTFDQALLAHVEAGRVSMEDAMKAATQPHDFKLLVNSGGSHSTSVDEVFATTG